MTQYIDKAAVVAEIERWACPEHGSLCDKLLEFLDSIEVKEVHEEPVSKDVEQEIEKYFANWLQGASDEGCFNANSELVSIYDCHRIARHFANWQKQYMMKYAEEAQLYQPNGLFFVETINKPLKHMEVGDKVKLIIIKED